MMELEDYIFCPLFSFWEDTFFFRGELLNFRGVYINQLADKIANHRSAAIFKAFGAGHFRKEYLRNCCMKTMVGRCVFFSLTNVNFTGVGLFSSLSSNLFFVVHMFD